MKTIVINPQNHTVTEAEYNGDFKEIYKLLSFEDQKVNTFDIVRIDESETIFVDESETIFVDESETIFVDDEGLINSNGARHGFFYVKGHHPVMLAGKGVILATDAEGESIATTLTVDQVKDMILFGEVEFNHRTKQASFIDTNGIIHPLDQ